MYSNELMGKVVLLLTGKKKVCAFAWKTLTQKGRETKTLADSTQIPGSAKTHPFACHTLACLDVLCQVDFPKRAFGNVACAWSLVGQPPRKQEHVQINAISALFNNHVCLYGCNRKGR